METYPKCVYHHEPYLNYEVSMPINLAKSIEGKYYVGYADELTFGKGKHAVARLYNPIHSNVILHVTVWTVTDISSYPIRAQIWFNTTVPAPLFDSELVTTSNFAICPHPEPKIKLQYANDVEGALIGGVKAFVRRSLPETTLVEDEQGKFMFPPGGSFLIDLSNPETPDESGAGRVAYGWWEEPIIH